MFKEEEGVIVEEESLLLNETGASDTSPPPNAKYGRLPHSKGQGGGAMTPPVSQWARGLESSCSAGGVRNSEKCGQKGGRRRERARDCTIHEQDC